MIKVIVQTVVNVVKVLICHKLTIKIKVIVVVTIQICQIKVMEVCKLIKFRVKIIHLNY
jgi:hypothetical protein